MDDLRPLGRGRLVLRALAILSALGFLTLVMLQAISFYEPPKPLPTTRPTKAAPVVPPRPPVEPEEPERRLYFPATKAGVLGPLKRSQPAPAPQR